MEAEDILVPELEQLVDELAIACGEGEDVGTETAHTDFEDAATPQGGALGLISAVYLQNVVGRFSLGCAVSPALAAFLQATHKHRQFNSVNVMLRKPSAMLLIFCHAGNCILTGCHSVSEFEYAARVSQRMLNAAARLLGMGSCFSVLDLKITNRVYTAYLLPKEVRVDVRRLDAEVRYTPGVYTGARIRIEDTSVAVLVFARKFVITGVLSREAADSARDYLEGVVRNALVRT